MRGLGSGHVICGEDLSNARKGLLHMGHTYIRTDRHTHGHRDYMTELAQWADSVKMQMFTDDLSMFLALQGLGT